MSAVANISPEVEFETKDGYKWFAYGEKDTGLRLIGLENLENNAILTTALANPQKRIAAHKAWAGARHSRAPGTPWEIMHEMGERGVDPDQKLEMTFKNYGHASVGDMASIQIDFVNIPMHFADALFSLSAINSGQQKSSRYQKGFGESVLHDIRNYLPESFAFFPKDTLDGGRMDSSEVETGRKSSTIRGVLRTPRRCFLPRAKLVKLSEIYQGLGKLSLELFAKHKEILEKDFVKYFKPADDMQLSSLNSRVLDCVRFFLLLGADTGLSFETSARDWVRIIATLKASTLTYYQKIGYQIERLLTPSGDEEKKLNYKAEAPALIRHTEALKATCVNLLKLKDFVEKKTDLMKKVEVRTRFRSLGKQKVELINKKYNEAEKVVTQYLLSIWPGLNRKRLLEWVKKQNKKVRVEIGKIIFGCHNHHCEMGDLAYTTGMSLVIDGFYGETLRDLVRHRAWGRFSSLPLVYGLGIDKQTIKQILAKGFGLPLYLSEVPRFKKLADGFANDLKDYYKKLYAFVDLVEKDYSEISDYSFVINLLPQAHRCELWMHGNPKQALYMTCLRARNGGHINYRMHAYDANQLIADSDLYFEGMRLKKKPDPKGKMEFFDRS